MQKWCKHESEYNNTEGGMPLLIRTVGCLHEA